jgi:hypothetical protein
MEGGREGEIRRGESEREREQERERERERTGRKGRKRENLVVGRRR